MNYGAPATAGGVSAMKTEWSWHARIVRMSSAAVVFASLSGLSTAAVRQVAEATLSTPSEIGEGDGEVPFTIQDGYLIVVEARIGERRRVKFALDTGATYSVLRADLAKGLEIAHRPVRIFNLDGVLTQERVNVV